MSPARLSTAALLLALGCGKASPPCVGAACPDLHGSYLAKLTPVPTSGNSSDATAAALCDQLQRRNFAGDQASFTLVQRGSALTASSDSLALGSHLIGTLLVDGTAQLTGTDGPFPIPGPDGGTVATVNDSIAFSAHFALDGGAAHATGVVSTQVHLQGQPGGEVPTTDCALSTTLDAARL